MPTTPLGITYPDGTGSTVLQDHFQALADDVDDLITTDRTARDAAFSTWIPTMAAQSGGSPAIGNGTYTARYHQLGKRVTGTFILNVGSTTNFGSGITYWALPVAQNSNWSGLHIGTVYLFDTSATARRLGAVMLDGTNQRCYLMQYDGSLITAAAPWTWASGDNLRAVFNYEAA